MTDDRWDSSTGKVRLDIVEQIFRHPYEVVDSRVIELLAREVIMGRKFIDQFDAVVAHNVALIKDGERLASWLANAPLDYNNGITHNGIDEGNIRGWKVHDKLLKQHKELKLVLKLE